jgi:AcrR family transcriptional regulator
MSVTELDEVAVTAAQAGVTTEDRVIDAALVCFGRWGIAKTTAEDIGREAGLSRATVYRAFPGGKAAILETVGAREIGRLMEGVVEATSAQHTLEDVLTEGIVVACRLLRTHPALGYLLEHEPEAVLPFLAFDRLGPALALARNGCGTTVARFVPLDTAEELVEWATRMALSLTFMPGRVDATRPETVAAMVRDLLVPGVAAERFSQPVTTPSHVTPHPKDTP